MAKRKNQPSSSDFKRVKAKVGKKALKPANETNTEVKCQSINVGQQNVVREGEEKKGGRRVAPSTENSEIHELLSTRGRSLEDIVNNLRHPAAAVRISAARGLKDAVTGTRATLAVIRANLAVLMPICGKCCVDEDEEVRQLALEILRATITRVCSSSEESQGGATRKEGRGYLKPFMPLLVAHISSALNSLDRKTQLDGTSMVNMISSIIPSLVVPFSGKFLPAYSIILSHRTATQSKDPETKTKKQIRNNKTKASDSPNHQVLQSFLALLKSGKSRRHGRGGISSTRTTDLSIVPGARGINSLFISRAPVNAQISLLPIRCRDDLLSATLLKDPLRLQVEAVERIPLTVNTTCALLEKLRDAFAEATQPEFTKMDLHEVTLILECTHLFYNSSCRSFAVADEKDPIVKVWSQYTNLMMGIFPFSAGPIHSNLVVEANLEICSTILDTYMDGMITTSHMDQVLAYLFGELERCRSAPAKDSSGNVNTNTITTTNRTDSSLFGALERLLVISRDQRGPKSSGEAIYSQLVRAMARTFFSTEGHTEITSTIARSPSTRRCVLLANEIFPLCDWSIQSGNSKSPSSALCQILQGCATLLAFWGSEFLFETDVVLTLLHSVARRFDVSSDELSREETALVDHIRGSLLPLLKHSKKRGSFFENFPVELQKKTLALIVILQAPTKGMLDGLSKVCISRWESSSDDTVSAEITSDILLSIHAIRRTISLQTFLGFIINSLGVTHKPFGQAQTQIGNISIRDVLRFDARIDVVSHILCQCGPSKVLELLQPLLEQWLTVDPSSIPTADELLTARTATSIVASCLSRLNGDCSTKVLICDVAPQLEKTMLTAICSILKHLPSSRTSDGAAVAPKENELAPLLDPFILLFQSDHQLFLSAYYELSLTIGSLSVSDQTRLLSALIAMSNDNRLFTVLRRTSADLVEHTKTIEKFLSSTSLERSAGTLRALLEVHLVHA